MPEVHGGEVEEVDDEQEFGEPVVAAHPEVHDAEEEEVVGEEVGGEVGGGGYVHFGFAVEGVGVVELENPEHDEVDAGDDAALGKGRGDVVLPDAAVRVMVLVA